MSESESAFGPAAKTALLYSAAVFTAITGYDHHATGARKRGGAVYVVAASASAPVAYITTFVLWSDDAKTISYDGKKRQFHWA